MSTLVMFALGIPLTLSMRDLIIQKNVSSQISDLIVKETDVFANADIDLITVIPRARFLEIKIEVGAPLNSISQIDIDRLRQLLTKNINQPIDLRVEVIPMRVIKSPQE